MLLSLQRRQQQEEAKQRKEQEAQAWREKEKAKEEEKQRKKVEQIQRRAAILEHYKLKKAMDEAEREVRNKKPQLLHTIRFNTFFRSFSGQTPRYVCSEHDETDAEVTFERYDWTSQA